MQPAADLSHLLGGAALALAFVLLTRRRPATLLRIAAAQSGVVAAAAAWQAWAQGSAVLAGMALAILLAGVGGLPWILRPHADAPSEATAAPGPMLAGAALLVGLALLAAARFAGLPPLREGVALALAAVLVALLALIARPGVLSQLVGLHALANGVALLAVAIGAAAPQAAAVVALFAWVAIGLAVQPAGTAP